MNQRPTPKNPSPDSSARLRPFDRVVHAAVPRISGFLREGVQRLREGLWPIALASLAAALAYATSKFLWDHPYPFFSAIAAWIIIGFSTEKKVRKVAELSMGVLLGVVYGEALRYLIGSGTWQIAFVIFTAALTARFLDRGVIFAIQAGVQSLLAMLMPFQAGMTPIGRFFDAVTGVLIAIVMLMLLTTDPRRIQRRAAIQFFRSLDETMTALALSARNGSAEVSRAALKKVRATSQSSTDQWAVANDAADELARFSPAGHRHAAEVQRFQHLLVGADRAMRNIRVIARRQTQFLDAVGGRPHSHLADAYLAGIDAIAAIREAIDTGADFTASRRALRLFSSYLTPEHLLRGDDDKDLGRIGHFEGITLVIQIRSLAIDLLEATGLDHADAQRFLPSLLVVSDGQIVGPRPLTQEISAVEPPTTTAAIESLILGTMDDDPPEQPHP
ncbi:FUSC family protein [Devriesea agamarum]|uniref:FUSC family protein n=1 Tax=Devriesea agamarum TaxID=472569 RepID=UPI00071C3F06|nr:FUSC family protein [Devriesea agamarum]